MIKLTSLIAPSFYQLHNQVKLNAHSSFWLKGGRGSTKSSFCAIEIILGIITEPNANALVLRKVNDTVRKSVMETLLWAIDMLDLNAYFNHTVAPAEITYLPTGQKIIMSGLDDARKLKSIKLKRGYFKFLWFEELEEFHGMEEIRSVRQSVRRGGDDFVEFASYNPPNDPAAWVNKEVQREEQGRIIHTSSYLDVPKEWLGKQFYLDAENLKRSDPIKYRHEYLGDVVGRAEQIVFHGKYEIRDFETPPVSELYQSRFFYGADWGFANDPTCLTRSFIRIENGLKNLYIERECGGVGIEIDDLPALFDTMPDSRKWRIYADCSRPETISYLANKRFNIAPAPKWQGSVEDGVEYLRSFNKIYVHSRCAKTAEELGLYSYKFDKNTQEILPVIVDKHNHYIDSIRYALADYIQANVSILDVI